MSLIITQQACIQALPIFFTDFLFWIWLQFELERIFGRGDTKRSLLGLPPKCPNTLFSDSAWPKDQYTPLCGMKIIFAVHSYLFIFMSSNWQRHGSVTVITKSEPLIEIIKSDILILVFSQLITSEKLRDYQQSSGRRQTDALAAYEEKLVLLLIFPASSQRQIAEAADQFNRCMGKPIVAPNLKVDLFWDASERSWPVVFF